MEAFYFLYSPFPLFTRVRGIGFLGSSPWIFSFVTVAVTLGRR
jgi:hypothetical protein